MLSPAKQLAYNEITVRYNSSETIVTNTPRRLMERNVTADDSDNNSVSTSTNEGNRQGGRASDLCTIQEHKTASDAEKSGETVCDEESCNSNKNLDNVFSQSWKILKQPSPVLTIIDNEHIIFNRVTKNTAQETLDSVYGNKSYGERKTDTTEVKDAIAGTSNDKTSSKTIKHSSSLDLGHVHSQGRRRKFSMETKLDTLNPSKLFLKEGVVSKVFDSDSSQKRDSIKSYLCDNESSDNEDDL